MSKCHLVKVMHKIFLTQIHFIKYHEEREKLERLARIGLTCILACVVSLFGTLWVYGESSKETEEKLNLYARAAVLLDGETSRLLYGENENVPMAMASTTKIMTCLVALENSDMDEIVTISDYAASMPDVQLDAVSGETFYMEDLLYSLMLESHNDVAVAIAEHIGGNEKGFAEMMNDRAREIGCKQTQFVTANGLDAEGHYTTAEELARITYEALKNEEFIKITNTPEYTFTNREGTREYKVHNKNSFLYLMDGAYGVKTGFTNDAGYCFVGAAEQDCKKLISVVLGSGWPPNKNYKWEDTKKLMNYGFDRYDKKEIGTDHLDVGVLEVKNGFKKKVILNVDCQTCDIILSEDDIVSIEIIRELTKNAPIKQNEIVGWVYYTVNNQIIKRFPIYTTEQIERKNFVYCLKTLLKQWQLF